MTDVTRELEPMLSRQIARVWLLEETNAELIDGEVYLAGDEKPNAMDTSLLLIARGPDSSRNLGEVYENIAGQMEGSLQLSRTVLAELVEDATHTYSAAALLENRFNNSSSSPAPDSLL